jgi:hypothetical protein
MLACFAMNALGAVAFSPPALPLRNAFGLPEAHPFYLCLIAAWILLFGCGYLYSGLSGNIQRVFLVVAAGGKASFAGTLLICHAMGLLPPMAALAGLPDLLVAGLLLMLLPRI